MPALLDVARFFAPLIGCIIGVLAFFIVLGLAAQHFGFLGIFAVAVLGLIALEIGPPTGRRSARP